MSRILTFAFLIGVFSFAEAQFVDPQNIVIRNLYIVTESPEVVPVSLLIRDNKLELVSKDEIPTPAGILAIDANGGFLIGELELNAPPSFIILSDDPRENFEVLLDTDSHAVFAIHQGQLRKNRLLYAADTLDEPEEEPKPQGWLAYTPPPMAIPTNYGDESKWNQWKTENTTGIFLAATVLDRQHWLSQNSDSEQQVGDLDSYDGGEIRGLRFGAVGTLNYFDKPWVYTVFAATNAFDKGFEDQQLDDIQLDDIILFDYRLDMPFTGNVTLSVGKQKEPISMERIMSMINLPMQERTSVSDALMPSRNLGAVLSGTSLNERMSWAGGIFNNFIDSDHSIGDTATQVVGRVTWLVFITEDESNLVHLGFGARLSNARQGVQYLTEPEFNKSPDFVDTDFIDADNAQTYNFEASWRRGPYWLAAEYVDANVDSPSSGNLSFSGYHITASWILSGEMRSYYKKSGIFGPVPVARSVYQNGWGAWEVAARWSSIDLTEPLVQGGEMDILSFGINWWLSPTFQVNANYRFITTDRDGLNGESSGLMTRVVLVLE